MDGVRCMDVCMYVCGWMYGCMMYGRCLCADGYMMYGRMMYGWMNDA